MDPISNVDRLAMLLRQRLAERSKADARRADGRRSAERPAAGQPPAVEALASAEGVGERQLRRAVVENILADQLGQGLRNEARFQQVVERVTDALADDPGTARLLNRVVEDMRRGAR
jgi:hypothetical protein